ncbi:hypothetical protein [Kitasatospora purpeofusca]|uniref:hypothetical protein n=1 Tax=Kitasatospora purpeofusca TaxID=67352 RepID=UPI0038160B9A
MVDRHLAQQTVPATGPAEQESAAGPAGREERTVSVPRDPLLRGLPCGMDVHVPLDPQMFGPGRYWDAEPRWRWAQIRIAGRWRPGRVERWRLHHVALFTRTGFWHRSWGVVAERDGIVRL